MAEANKDLTATNNLEGVFYTLHGPAGRTVTIHNKKQKTVLSLDLFVIFETRPSE